MTIEIEEYGVALDAHKTPVVRINLSWKWPANLPPVIVDASAFLLNNKGFVYIEQGWAMVFYGQPIDSSCAVLQQTPCCSFNQDRFQVTLPCIPEAVQRLVFCLTLEATVATPTFNALASIQTELIYPATREVLGAFSIQNMLGTENGLIVAELRRNEDQWWFYKRNESFAGRLSALARHFGILSIDERLPAAGFNASVAVVHRGIDCVQAPRSARPADR